jgi:hypothetical protein
MRKLRDDSTWNQLRPEQRETLESWLFDENLGYAETLARVRQEFQVEASVASVGRYYRRRARERQAVEMVAAEAEANAINALPVTADSLRTAAVKLVGNAALKLARERPHEVEALAALARLLLESEDIAIRRGRLALAERYFQFENTAAAQQEWPKLRAYLAAVGDDPSLSHEQKIERVCILVFGREAAKAAEGVPAQNQGGN